ncbi:MAG: hypothetical protein M1365_05020, partial [Actinobacteria bacterium]|nr:hypothetical protein [Actinomycetota bacterium]
MDLFLNCQRCFLSKYVIPLNGSLHSFNFSCFKGIASIPNFFIKGNIKVGAYAMVKGKIIDSKYYA